MSELTAVIIAYNEADLLGHTLPSIREVCDYMVVVDMGSTDQSSAFYEKFLTPKDLVLSYPRSNLNKFGFAHPRNFGAKHAKTEWIFAIDCDEYVDVDEFMAARGLLTSTRASVFNFTRQNYSLTDEVGLGDIGELIRRAPHSDEFHRRLYRNDPRVRWEGMIHEELWIDDINAYYNCEMFPVTIHHLNQYRRTGSSHLKFGLYSYLTLRAIEYPGLRYGTNSFWFEEYPKKNIHAMFGAARDYASENGLEDISEANVLRQLADDGIVIEP
jgi:glycosyltransferase involved in cell wall biosynthesis